MSKCESLAPTITLECFEVWAVSGEGLTGLYIVRGIRGVYVRDLIIDGENMYSG